MNETWRTELTRQIREISERIIGYEFAFESPDEQTRIRVRRAFTQRMDEIDVQSFTVICDETNNPSLNNNLLNIDIYVRPWRSTEMIQYNIGLSGTGVGFINSPYVEFRSDADAWRYRLGI